MSKPKRCTKKPRTHPPAELTEKLRRKMLRVFSGVDRNRADWEVSVGLRVSVLVPNGTRGSVQCAIQCFLEAELGPDVECSVDEAIPF